MKHVKFILAILIMLVIVIIVVQNHEPFSTEVRFRIHFPYLQWQTSSISVYYIVTIAFLFGVLITGLFGMFERFRLKKEIRVLRKRSSEKDAELNSLRNLPITTDDVTPTQANDMNGVT
jgi:ATP adenylyltransferase